MEYLIKGSSSSSRSLCPCFIITWCGQYDPCPGKCTLCAMKGCGAGGKSVPYNLLLK